LPGFLLGVAKIFHGASPTVQKRLQQAGNFKQQAFRLLGMRANQLGLHVTIQPRQCSAIFRLHVVAQSDPKLGQDFDGLRDGSAAFQDVTGLQSSNRFVHRLHGSLIQNPDQLHGRGRLHALSHVLLVLVQRRHLDSYRCVGPTIDNFSIPAFEGKAPAQRSQGEILKSCHQSDDL
jgi:hypothetical protein